MLEAFIEHRREVVTRRTVYELAKAEAKAHILEGLTKALEHIDQVVEIIKKAASAAEAKMGLKESFGLSNLQAQAILDMRLSKLTALETKKIYEDLEAIRVAIARYKEILSDDGVLFGVIKGEINEILEKFGDERRSEISHAEDKEFDVEDFVQPEDVVVTLSNLGYAKRTAVDVYRAQGRGGKGVKGASTSAGDTDDHISSIFVANTHDHLLCFTNLGRLYWLKVYQIPEMARTARGRPLVQLLNLSKNEQVQSVLPLKEFTKDKHIVMVTRNGTVKKTDLMAFSRIRSSGIIAISFDEGDELIRARIADIGDDVFMATKKGQSIRFNADAVRAMGRTARGVKGIGLSKEDEVVGMEVISGDSEKAQGMSILSVSSKGYGKRTEFEEYRSQGRGGSGIKNIKVSDKIGDLVSVRTVHQDDDVIVISNKGQLIRTNVNAISMMGRATQGVRVMRVDSDETVQAVAVIHDVEQDKATIH